MNILNWLLFKDSFSSFAFLLAFLKLGLSSNYEQMTLETTSFDTNIQHGAKDLFCNDSSVRLFNQSNGKNRNHN